MKADHGYGLTVSEGALVGLLAGTHIKVFVKSYTEAKNMNKSMPSTAFLCLSHFISSAVEEEHKKFHYLKR